MIKRITAIVAVALICLSVGMVIAATVTPSTDAVAVFGYPTVGYVDSSGNLVLGGSFVASISATNITSGNIAAARMTNGLATSGSSIGGNIPVAAITNAAATVGPSIGGNIPSGAVSNVLNTAGLAIGAWNINAATNVPAGNLVGTIAVARMGGLTITQNVFTALAGVTNSLFFTNGVLVNVIQL